MNIRMGFSLSAKSVFGILITIFLNLHISFGRLFAYLKRKFGCLRVSF